MEGDNEKIISFFFFFAPNNKPDLVLSDNHREKKSTKIFYNSVIEKNCF